MTEHGGNVQEVATAFGLSPETLLDFSSNINPKGLPLRAAQRLSREAEDMRLLMRYPDPEACELRGALGMRLKVKKDAVVVGNGAAALIAACIRAFRSNRCLLPCPAFGEYLSTCAVSGCAVDSIPLRPDGNFILDADETCRRLKTGQYDLVIITNPHNPSGALTPREAGLRILNVAESAGVHVLLDEAFIDYVPSASLTIEAEFRKRTAVIRSLTKFYGCPALRVGYAVANPLLAGAIRSQLAFWPVSTLALSAAVEAVSDDRYAEETVRVNQLERLRLMEKLVGLGFHVFPSTANFLLLRIPPGRRPTASELYERLIVQHHVLVRNCDSYESLEKGCYLRVAVRLPSENDYLVGAFAKVVAGDA